MLSIALISFLKARLNSLTDVNSSGLGSLVNAASRAVLKMGQSISLKFRREVTVARAGTRSMVDRWEDDQLPEADCPGPWSK